MRRTWILLQGCSVFFFWSTTQHTTTPHRTHGPPTVNSPFPLLEDVLRKAHPSLGFNLEVKVRRCVVGVVRCWLTDTLSLSLSVTLQYADYLREERLFLNRNDYVDAVLECVGKWAANRPIYFSSFDPGQLVCVLFVWVVLLAGRT